MIAFLDGILAGKGSNEAYIDVGGVGYLACMSASSISKLPEIEEPVRILTYMNVTESGITLYGFLEQLEMDIFKAMISVSGIGPKLALAALSTFSPEDLIEAIVLQDVKTLSHIPGVGKKSAQRIALEIKDKFSNDGALPTKNISGEGAGTLAIVREALLSMGFTSSECELALKGAPADAEESDLLQYALKKLAM